MMDILHVGMLHYDSFAYHLNFDPDQWGMSIQSITPDSISHVIPDSFDVVVTTCEYDPVSIDMVRHIKALGIPVLLVLDGVLEWRNNWDRPFDRNDAVQVPFLLPAFSDKIGLFHPSAETLAVRPFSMNDRPKESPLYDILKTDVSLFFTPK